jgi:hypothetical protein
LFTGRIKSALSVLVLGAAELKDLYDWGSDGEDQAEVRPTLIVCNQDDKSLLWRIVTFNRDLITTRVRDLGINTIRWTKPSGVPNPDSIKKPWR